MILFLEVDEGDEDVLIAAIAVSDDGLTTGDMRLDLPPGHSFAGVPYEIFKAAAPGEYTLEELQQRASHLTVEASEQDQNYALSSPCSADELMALVAEQFDDEDWTLPDDRGRPHEPSPS